MKQDDEKPVVEGYNPKLATYDVQNDRIILEGTNEEFENPAYCSLGETPGKECEKEDFVNPVYQQLKLNKDTKESNI